MAKKSRNIWKDIVFPLMLTAVFMLTLGLLKSEIASLIMLAAVIVITFLISYTRREWILLTAGIIAGVVLEIGGDMVYQLQYWNTESFWGIPLWLPLLWGFQFVIVYRIGSAIMKK